LYTRYFKGRDEYRIHVAGGEVIDRQQKRRRLDDEGEAHAFNAIRNVANGWVFCRDDVEVIPMADEAAVAAVDALGLDFGAVDLKVNQQRTRVGVLEVNTAPGLEGTSLGIYAAAIRRLV
jgi:glutathione synthase/RimK-type ligase-like ATP-grasp enzyme